MNTASSREMARGGAVVVAEQGREVAAVDVVHDEVAHAVLLAVAVDGGDPRVVEGLEQLDLVVELGGEVGVVAAASGQQQLDHVRGGAVLRVVLVARQVQAEARAAGGQRPDQAKRSEALQLHGPRECACRRSSCPSPGAW